VKGLSKKISERFNTGEPVIIATVISGQGSAPRKPGAKMIFLQDGLTAGTIGGGALEAAVEKAAAMLWTTKGALIKSFDLRNDEAGELGMVCGGTQQILLAWLAPSTSHQNLLQRLFQPENIAAPVYLMLRLKGPGPEFSQAELGLLDSHYEQLGMETDRTVILSLAETFRRQEIYLSEPINDTVYYVERLNTQDSLYLFGAGHVARPVVEIASLVGFRTVVLDDREKFASQDNFPRADEVIVLDDFNHALDSLSLASGAYVVIVTRGHAHDQTILEQVLATSATYIGMIGSRTKVAHCFQSLKEKGFSQDQLARVHAPIGLKIGSETPEEIAVSIVAQLIQVRSQSKL
jgi:xanthine dehydrogenase accessory factor